mmetsp:Transcript_22888/g.47997  ORF Transcript_22888/g.47997 Transcript_22888/m.47997 type:complete len:101 (+) Transcript_22888:1027-1329(+)
MPSSANINEALSSFGEGCIGIPFPPFHEITSPILHHTIDYIVMHDSGIHANASHISRPVPGQNRRWYCDTDLIVEYTTEFRISYQSSVPFHHGIASVEIQ